MDPYLLIERYSPAKIRAIFTDQRKYELWLRIELLAAEAWAAQGRVPAEALPRLQRASFDVERIKEMDDRLGHDVIAFLTVVGETVGDDSRYLHLGLTSSDVGDTAFALQLREAMNIVIEDLGRLRDQCAQLAVRHRRTLMVGRTHGIHAEPITFGFKVAGWTAELDRDLERCRAAVREVAVGKLSGAVGTHATVPPEVERHVCDALQLQVDPVSTQVVARDRHAVYLATLAVVAGTLERIALEVRHLQRSEVGEAYEPFGREQKGSSAMPHKRNPVLCERVCGLARVVRGYSMTAFENTGLWHERDISHSSGERVVFPDALALVDYMTTTMRKVVEGLEVHPERMERNLLQSGGVIFSQRVLLALVESGMSRDDAYRLVQSAAHRALAEEGGFRELLEAQPEVQKRLGDSLGTLFDPSWYLAHTDLALDSLGLGVKA